MAKKSAKKAAKKKFLGRQRKAARPKDEFLADLTGEHEEEQEKQTPHNRRPPNTAPNKPVETTITKLQKLRDEGEIVCPVPRDPEAGDKTPAIEKWWWDNHPEIAVRKYGDRYTARNPRPQSARIIRVLGQNGGEYPAGPDDQV